MNGDTNLDAVLGNEGARNQVCLGNGAGGFACSDVSADTNRTFGVALGELNGDANLDVVFANRNQGNRVCLGDGAGGFTCSSIETDVAESLGVALGFVNGDGHLDVVFANQHTRNRVCLGSGTGGFTCGDVSPDSNRSFRVALGHANGDTNLDVVFANHSQRNRVCLGNGAGGFTCSDIHTDTNSSVGVGMSMCTNGSMPPCSVGIFDDVGPVTSNVQADPNPVPIASTGTALTAVVDESHTGGSNIKSAAYEVRKDSGTVVSGWMQASDGHFDTATENVEAFVGMGPFSEAGVYEACVQGSDHFDNEGPEDCAYLVVYDPDGGFVTGGGWIHSPEGACQLTVACQDAAGRANFGFVSKYKKGAHTPSGQTEFHFRAGNLNFHSDSYEWMVIAGPKAMYKGVGAINGGGNYGFLLMALDEKLTPSTDVDLFRIKIWDRDNFDAAVYDNEMGEADNADPTTAVAGASIVIHKK